ncbi:MAG TPA: cation-translocating P-type ATPase C-terminal domain-containing protein, partial [Patescibacteria group bacterium]|nr:cation-translocating P-type ATPase C-terminal domain-containing protein [Patescibacteria group bacterium]
GVSTIPLSLEKKEGDVLKHKPRRPGEPIINRLMVSRIALVGLVMMTGTLALFTHNLDRGLATAQSSALLVLAAFQWFNVFNARSETESIFKLGLFSNRYVILSTTVAVLLQIGATYLPFMQEILKTAPLTLTDWVAAISLASSIILLEEGRKILFRKRKISW